MRIENQYNSRIVLREVRIVNLLRAVRIFTLRITIIELLVRRLVIISSLMTRFLQFYHSWLRPNLAYATRIRFIEPVKER